MKTRIICGLIIVSMVTISCKQVVLKITGISNPKVENKSTIMEFLKKCKGDTSNVYCIDTTLFQKMKTIPFKPGWTKGFRPLQIRVYGETGNPIMQWASCEGFLSQLKLFEEVPPRNVNSLSTELDLQSDLSQYYALDGQPAKLTMKPGYDYYIIIYFAVWLGKQSKESIKTVTTYVQDHPEYKFMVYQIDVDCQEFWGVSCNSNIEIH
jgi:hypothetical protein